MKKKFNLPLVTGDPNLVTANEIYVELNEDNEITALKKRGITGSLDVIVDEHVDQYVLEDEQTETKSLAQLAAGDTIEVTPSSGNDGMKKVTIIFTE